MMPRVDYRSSKKGNVLLIMFLLIDLVPSNAHWLLCRHVKTALDAASSCTSSIPPDDDIHS